MPGGSGGAPGGSSPTSRHRPQFASVWQPKSPVDINNMFDDKMAASDKFSYGGGGGAASERWRKTIRGYWIAKCPVLQPLLDWAELFEQAEITPEAVQLMLMDEQYMIEAHSIDVLGLSTAIWGFLNTCLKGEAREVFDGANILDGLNGWRLVINEMRKSRGIRLQQLRKLVRNPKPINKIEEVSAGITAFDRNIKEFEEMQNVKMDDFEKKADLLESLPQVLRENLHWRSVSLP